MGARPEGGHDYPVVGRTVQARGRVITYVTDQVVMPDGQPAARDYVRHPGAVGVVALDEAERVVLISQYRHPVGHRLWELPAGLLDVTGEPLVEAAARELAEEVDLVATRWDLLLDMHVSPGCSTEVIRLYLARGLGEVPEDRRHRRQGEEAELEVCRVDLDKAVGMALSGEITNAACAVGVLAAAASRARGWADLRAVDTPLTTTRWEDGDQVP